MVPTNKEHKKEKPAPDGCWARPEESRQSKAEVILVILVIQMKAEARDDNGPRISHETKTTLLKKKKRTTLQTPETGITGQ